MSEAEGRPRRPLQGMGDRGNKKAPANDLMIRIGDGGG
ncbi:MAG: hypothetical protein RL077_6359 [Verrucomicrobiota bacterium]